MKTVRFKRYIKGNHLLKKEIRFYLSGDKHWFLNGQYHREDGPSFIRWDGYKEWWLNGECHRVDGPAIEYNDGTKQWFLNGKRIFSEENYWIVIKKYK